MYYTPLYDVLTTDVHTKCMVYDSRVLYSLFYRVLLQKRPTISLQKRPVIMYGTRYTTHNYFQS